MKSLRIAGPSSHLLLSALMSVALSTFPSGCGGNAGGGSGGGGDGGSGGAGVCEAFVTEPAQTAVTVRIVNDTASDLYIGPEAAGGCGEVDPFSVQDAGGQPLGWRLQQCSFTCEMLQTGGCGCTADCPIPVVWRIVPGGALEVPWNGTVFTSETMPDECYDASCGVGVSCLVEREPEGALTLEAAAWSEVTGSCGASCTCTPDGTGSCAIDSGDAVVGGNGIFAKAEVGAPGAEVEIVFQQ